MLRGQCHANGWQIYYCFYANDLNAVYDQIKILQYEREMEVLKLMKQLATFIRGL